MDYVAALVPGESLGLGDEGPQVGELQRMLGFLGYFHDDVDDRFGDATESALREFQRLTGRVDDGRVDSETWESLDTAARSAGYGAEQAAQDAAPFENDQAGQYSEDGAWWWDGTDWVAVDGAEPPADETTAATASPAISEFPDLEPGDEGEWVAYLDTMLRSKGF